MPRTITVELTAALAQTPAQAPVEISGMDSLGRAWRGEIRNGNLVLIEVVYWTATIEGTRIGTAVGTDPKQAALEILSSIGLNSLPEAIPVKVFSDEEAWILFTLSGTAFFVPTEEFVNDVVNSTRWVQARQARRVEIDALIAELRKAK